MFVKYLKNLSVKRLLNSSLHLQKPDVSLSKVKTVGIIIDETYFFEKEQLIDLIIANNIKELNIKVIVYNNKTSKNAVYARPTFSNSAINIKGEIVSVLVNDFINEHFDLLINYYNEEKPQLLLISDKSKAKFKVGFTSVDKRIHHLMINTNIENYAVFVHELFKYLKILNKI
jgi:hypothetical protein